MTTENYRSERRQKCLLQVHMKNLEIVNLRKHIEEKLRAEEGRHIKEELSEAELELFELLRKEHLGPMHPSK